MNALALILALLLGAPTDDPRAVENAPTGHAPPARDIVIAPEGDRGPDVLSIDELVHFYGPVRFDHKLHVSMSQMTGGCTNCHHDLGTSTVAAACKACHPAEGAGATLSRPSLKGSYHRQCLGCHRDWSHENGCGFCHREAAASLPTHGTPDPTDILGVSHPRMEAAPRYVYQTTYAPAPFVTFQHIDHVEIFGLRCVDCHRGASCAGCHGPDAVPRIVSRAQNCYGCHSEKRCVFCHDVSVRPRFNHAASTGWSLAPGHVGIACVDCHGTDHTMSAPPSAGCRACHGTDDGFDHGQIGVTLTGSHAYFDCVCCHRGSDAATSVSCAGCHADRSYPTYMPGQPLDGDTPEASVMPAGKRSVLPVRDDSRLAATPESAAAPTPRETRRASAGKAPTAPK